MHYGLDLGRAVSSSTSVGVGRQAVSVAHLEVVKDKDGVPRRIILSAPGMPPCEVPAVASMNIAVKVGDVGRLTLEVLIDRVDTREALEEEL